jgi:hypothetical protein
MLGDAHPVAASTSTASTEQIDIVDAAADQLASKVAIFIA